MQKRRFSVNRVGTSSFGFLVYEFAHSLQQDGSPHDSQMREAFADWVRYAWYQNKSLERMYADGNTHRYKGWVGNGYACCGYFEALRERYNAMHPEAEDEWEFMRRIVLSMRNNTYSTFCTETFGLSKDALSEMWKNDLYLTNAVQSVLSGSDAAAMTSNHVLDLGGAAKMFCGSLKGGGEPILIDGTTVRNGTMTVYPLEGQHGWWSQIDSTYTIGGGASFIVKERTDQGGQMNLQGGAKLVIDGGYVEAGSNRGNGSGQYGHYVGCDSATAAQIDVRNGGRFRSSHLYVSLGDSGNATGTASVTNGTFEAAEGGIRVAPNASGTGRLLADGSRIVASWISLGHSAAGGLAEVDIRNSMLELESIYVNKAPRAGSRVKLDGVTIKTGAEGEIFRGFSAGLPLQIGAGGVTVSNFYDTASSAVMTGGAASAAVLTKRGSGVLSLGGDISALSGDIVIQEGTVAFRAGFRSASGKKVTASAGTAVGVTVDSGFRASTADLVLGAGGTVAIVVEESASVPIGAEIAVFKGLASGTSVSRLAVPSSYEVSVKSDGRVVLRRVQKTSVNPPRASGDIYWCGSPGQYWNTDDAWLLNGEANYYLDGDRIHFETAGFSSLVTEDAEPAAMFFAQSGSVGGSGRISVPAIDVSARATATVDAPVATAFVKTGDGVLELGGFTSGRSLDVEAGTVRLASGAVENPLSTAKNANVVKGVLDLGGAGQTFYTSLDSRTEGLLRDGGEIRNGTFTVVPVGYLRMPGTVFTVGAGADLTISQTTGANGRVGLRDDARLNIAGGSVTACNPGAYGYVGCDTPSRGEIRITGGGSFRQTVSAMRVGWNAGSQVCVTGVVSVAGGTFSIPASKELSLADGANAVAVVAVTNGTLDAGLVRLCETGNGGHVEFTMKNSAARLRGFEAAHEADEGSFIVFDGATIVADGDNDDFLGQVVPTVTIGGGGLVVTNDGDIAVSAGFAGSGALAKHGTGVLALGSSRAAQTTLAEGALALTDGATIDAGRLTLGTDPGRPVTIDFGGQSLALDISARSIVGKAAGGSVSIRNGEITVPAVLRVWNGSLTLGAGARVSMDTSANRWVCVGGNSSGDEAVTTKDALLVLDGASLANDTGSHLGIGDFGSAPSKGSMLVKNGGSYVGRGNIYVAQGCEGHLVIDGDGSSATANSLVFCGETRDEAGENGYVELANGGVLAVGSVAHGKGLAEGRLRFDGGVLRATADGTLLHSHRGLSCETGSGGGTIDNGGFAVSIAQDISGEGVIAFAGRGVTTLSAGVEVAGGISVASGTTLALNGNSTGSLSLAGGAVLSFENPSASAPSLSAASVSASAPVSISVAGVSAGARYPLVSGLGSTPASAFTLASGPAAGTLRVQSGILWLYAGEGFVWTGEGTDGLMGNPRNWLCGLAPTNGSDLAISVPVPSTIVCDIASFAPNSIVFTEGSAAVAVNSADGCSITGIGSVANRSGSEATFVMPVVFAEAIDKSGSGVVRFAGGATGTIPAGHSEFYGAYNLTAASWSLSSDITLAAGTVVDAPGMSLDSNGWKIGAETGASLTVGILHPGSGGTIFGAFAGDFAARQLYAEGTGAISLGQGFSGTMRVGHVQLHSGSSDRQFTFNPAEGSAIVVGGTGFRAKRGTISLDGCVLRSSGDWAFDIEDNGYKTASMHISVGSSGLVVDTSDYDAAGSAGHTVTVKDSSSKSDDMLTGAGGVTATGGGTMSFRSSAKFTGGFTAADGVTLALSSGALPGAGDVAMAKGTTLEVPFAADSGAAVAGAFNITGGNGDTVAVRIGELQDRAVCGRIKVLTAQGGFGAGVAAASFALANPTASGAAPSFEIVDSGNGSELWLDAGAAGYVWTGAGANRLMSNPANWLGGAAPTEGGETLYFGGGSATTVLSDIDGFSPSNIVFAAGSAKFTIGGSNGMKPVSGIASVVCGADAEAEFAVPVYFAGDIDKSGDGVVRFDGGAYGALPVNHSKFYGTYNLSAEAWDLTGAIVLAENATVDAPGTALSATGSAARLNAEKGSLLVLKSISHTSFRGDVIGSSFEGDLDVRQITFDRQSWYWLGENFTGTLRLGKLYSYTTSNGEFLRIPGNFAEVVVDGYGLSVRRGTVNLRDVQYGHCAGPLVFRSASDWKFGTEKPGSGICHGYAIPGYGIEIDTTDRDDRTLGRTVTVELANGTSEMISGPSYVSCFGAGRLFFKSSCTFTGGLVASNGVTLALADGVTPGAGDVTMERGTTLEIPFTTNCTASVAGRFGIAEGNGGTVAVRIGSISDRAVCGRFRVLTVDGGFADGVSADTFSLVNPVASGIEAVFSIVGDELWLDVGETGCVWSGAGADGSLSNPDNWLGGNVPDQGGETVYFGAEKDTAVNCDMAGFSPAEIVFPAGSAAFTFSGANPVEGILKMTSRSAARHVFSVPVCFDGCYLVDFSETPVLFAGGAYAACPDESISSGSVATHTLCGEFRFSEDWTIPDQPAGNPFVIASGARVYGRTLAAESYQNSRYHLRIDDGAVAEFDTVAVAGRLVFRLNGGRLVATGDVALGGDASGRDFGYYGAPNDGTVEANAIVKTATGYGTIYQYVTNMVVGSGGYGMLHKDYSIQFQRDLRLTARDDMTIHSPAEGGKDGDWDLNLNGHALTVDTAGHSVLFESHIRSVAGTVVKEGEGELVMQGLAKKYTGGTSVKGGTVTVKKTDALGTGPVTVGAGATLRLSAPAGSSLANAVTAEDGASIAFNFEDGALAGSLSSLSLPASGSLNVSVSGLPASAGVVYTLVSGGAFTAADLGRFSISADPSLVFDIPSDGVLAVTAPSGEYVWNAGASGADWTAVSVWTRGGTAASWLDVSGNTAAFEHDGDRAALSSPVSAALVRFAENAAVDAQEGASLAAAEIGVAAGKTATVNAQTAGALEKTGAGTLALGSSRTERTTLSEGTLRMASGATLDPAKLTLGTDASKPVSLDCGGQTLTANPTAYLGAGMDVTLADGMFACASEIKLSDATFPSVLTIAGGATLQTSDRFNFNTSGEATVNVAGGTLKSLADNNNWLMQASQTGRLDINVTGGGLLEFGGETYMLTCRDGDDAYQSPELHLNVVDSTLRVKNGKSLRLGRDEYTKASARPVLALAATNSVFDVAYGLYIGSDKSGLPAEGAYTADFSSCVITTSRLCVYSDRTENRVAFDRSRLVFSADGTLAGDAGRINVASGGLELDTNGKNSTLAADLGGPGAVTKTGAGILTVGVSQTAAAPLNVEAGTLAVGGGLTVARSVAVASVATLSLPDAASGSVALGALTLADGATLAVADLAAASAAPLAVSSLALGGGATLRLDGAPVADGMYDILVSSADLPAEAGAAFAVANPPAGKSARVFAEGNRLVLAVGGANVWTGLGDGSWTDGGDWLGGETPAASAEAYFTESLIVRARTAVFGSSVARSANTVIDAGTASDPVVFSATDGNGIASTKDLAVAVSGDANLTLEGGAHTFGSCYVGTGDNLTGVVTNDGAAVTVSRLALADHNGATGRFVNRSGTVTVGGWVTVGGAKNRESAPNHAFLEVSGGALRNTSASLGIGDFGAAGSTAEVVVKGGGVYESAADIRVLQGGAGSASLVVGDGGTVVASGSVKLCGESRGTGDGGLRLESGGVLSAKQVSHGTGTGTGMFTFAGGTLRALASGTFIMAHDRLGYTAAGTSTIDNGGFDITVAADIAGSGALKLAGGGVTAVAADQTHTGDTTVTGGTAIRSGAENVRFAGKVVFMEGSRLALAKVSGGYGCISAKYFGITGLPAGSVSVEVPSDVAEGVFTILARTASDSGTFSDANLAAFAIAEGAPAHASLRLSADRKSLCLAVGAPNVWTGAAGDGLMSTPGNWLDGRLPVAELPIDFSRVASATAVEADLEAVFPTVIYGSGLVTLSGHLRLATLTNDCTTARFDIASGAELEIDGDLVLTSGDGSLVYMSGANDGTLRVGGLVRVEGSAKGYPSWSGSGTNFVGGVVCNSTGDNFKLNSRAKEAPVANWIVGDAGFTSETGKKSYWIDRGDGDRKCGTGANVVAAADFEIAAPLGVRQPLAVITEGPDGAAHTVTATASIYMAPADGTDNTVTVSGRGVFAADYAQPSVDRFKGWIRAASGATLSLAGGVDLGEANVAVAGGAVLALPASARATAAVSGRLELDAGAAVLLSGLAADATPLTVGTLIERGDSAANTGTAVRFAGEEPAPGVYTIVTRTDSDVISQAHIDRTRLDASADLVARSSFAIGGTDSRSIVLTVRAPSMWPAAWNGGSPSDETMQTAYDEWAKTNDWRAENAEAAFLMGVDVADYEPLAPTSVVRADGSVSVGVNADLSRANGRPFVLTSATLDAPEGEWEKADADVGEGGRVLIDLDGKDGVRFFRICIGY